MTDGLSKTPWDDLFDLSKYPTIAVRMVTRCYKEIECPKEEKEE